MTQMGEIGSEFSAPRIPFEEFVKRPAWQAMPFLIQLALLHLRRAEQHPLLEKSKPAAPLRASYASDLG